MSLSREPILPRGPSSHPGSPTEDAGFSYPDSFTKEHVSALRARVQEEWTKLLRLTATQQSGRPLAHLLRIGVTSGKAAKAGRWAGTRVDNP